MPGGSRSEDGVCGSPRARCGCRSRGPGTERRDRRLPRQRPARGGPRSRRPVDAGSAAARWENQGTHGPIWARPVPACRRNGSGALATPHRDGGAQGEQGHARDEAKGEKWPAAGRRRNRRRGSDTSSDCPRSGEPLWVEGTVPDHVLGGAPFGLGFFDISRQVCCHLVGNGIWNSEAPPFPTALLNELIHGRTSALTRSRAPSTASRAICHSRLPASSAFSPAGERL